MIVGTMVQTLILAYIILRCDWNDEVGFSSLTSSHHILSLLKNYSMYFIVNSFLQALKASDRMQRWSSHK
jgi:hypothetical protein